MIEGVHMFHCNRTTRTLRVIAALLLCAALVTDVAIAAPPTLQTVAVTPTAVSISVGQKQRFTATGTFSNGSTHALGPAISDIAAGMFDTCALLTSGGVECWGDNSRGGLGDGSRVDSLIPRPVKGITTATAVAYSKHLPWWGHGCALLARGAVRCWGLNSSGQLGNGVVGSPWDSTTPVTVRGMTSATAIAAGGETTCALLASGAVQCWGAGDSGQLGNGFNGWSPIPVSVTGIGTAIAVTAGESHSCASLASGAVQCWGSNGFGELGDGTTTDSNTPVTVRGIGSATAVAAGIGSTCALLASGAVQCWGWNGSGQLGDGSNVYDSTIPVTVAGISTAVAIAAGGYHHCAVLSNGSTRCWGFNSSGCLGNGTTIDSNTPVRVHEFNSPTRLMAGGYEHTCALLFDGTMRCWGMGSDGQLGTRRRADSTLPVNVVGTPGVVWESSDPSKATIGARGWAKGRAVGNTTITATIAGFINDNAVLTVK
jgi:alpha-tubulin suppressor-like RCC1 family protein